MKQFPTPDKNRSSADVSEYIDMEYSNQEESYSEQAYTPNNVQYCEDTSQPRNNGMMTVLESSSTNQNLLLLQDAIPPAKYASMGLMTEEFWREKKQKMMEIREEDMLNKTKNMSVPMARVKKIMRIDDDVRNFMIASDAPIFMAQAAEFFIEEMTAMGWQYVSEARRRILQKADIASAVQKSDQFDFLIDFLPAKNSQTSLNSNSTGFSVGTSSYVFNDEITEPKRTFPEDIHERPGYRCATAPISRGTTEYHLTPKTSACPSALSTSSSLSINRSHQNGTISK